MKKQAAALEIAGIVASPAAAYFAYRYARILAYPLIEGSEGIAGLLLALLFVSLVPSFLAVFAASILQTNRYRIVNASLATFVVVVLNASLATRMLTDAQGFILWCVFLAGAMGSALGATQIWKAAVAALSRKRTAAEPPAAAAEPPANSVFLTALAVISIPIVLVNILASAFVSIGISAAVLFILFQLPRIPVFLIAAAAILPFAALWAAVKAMIAIAGGRADSQAAAELPRSGQPELYAMADEVAAMVGSKPADRIILHVFPTFFVTQGKVSLLDGAVSGRILALGMPLAGRLGPREFRSVLAHEFAHFAKGDLTYSIVVSPAYRALGEALGKLSSANPGGSAGAFMTILRAPLLLFLANSYEYFATIDRMLQRGREFRADRAAAELYGRSTFVSALEKVSVSSELFGKVAETIRPREAQSFFAQLDEAIDGKRDSGEEILRALRTRAEDPLDTHPSIAARAARLPDIAGSQPEDPAEALPSFEAEGRRLSALAVEKLGIRLAEAEESEESEESAAEPEA
jgi:Zn-dependent protease with chaperone function